MKKLFILILLFFLIPNLSLAGQQGTILAQRVSSSGTIIGSPITVSPGQIGHVQSQARISFFNDRFLVVWQEFNGTDLDVKAVRISIDGTIIDNIPLDIASGTRTQSLPDVDADSSGWMVVWSAFDDTDLFPSLFACRVDYDGTLHSPLQFGDTRYISDQPVIGFAPRIAWSPDQGKFLVVFSSIPYYGAPRITQVILSSTPSVSYAASDGIVISKSSETYYDVAYDPGGTWTYTISGDSTNEWDRNSGTQVAVTVNSSGVYPSEVCIGSFNLLNEAYTACHTGYLDDSSSKVAGGEYAWNGNAIASDSEYTIAVWSRYHVGGGPNPNQDLYNSDLYAARVDGYDPVESVKGTPISTTSSSEEYPSIAGNKLGNLLLVYTKTTSGSSEIIGKILTVDEAGITSGSEIQLRGDTTGKRRSHSDVAYGSSGEVNEFLVVWTEGWWGTL